MKYSIIALLFLISCSVEGNEKEVKEKITSKKEDTVRKEPKKTEKENHSQAQKEKNGTTKLTKQCKVELDAYIDDPTETATNIRKTPGGEIVLELPYAQDDYFLTIVDQKGDWFKVNSIEGIEESYDLPDGGAWVHNSVVGAGTRNYGNQEVVLYSSDDENAKKIGVISTEIALHILAVCGEWVKVKTEPDHSVGWIKKEWICGNPLTTCS